MEKEIYEMNKLFENTGRDDRVWIYESPDGGKTVYRREFGKTERELVIEDEDEWSLDGRPDREFIVDQLQNVSLRTGYGFHHGLVQYENIWRILFMEKEWFPVMITSSYKSIVM